MFLVFTQNNSMFNLFLILDCVIVEVLYSLVINMSNMVNNSCKLLPFPTVFLFRVGRQSVRVCISIC